MLNVAAYFLSDAQEPVQGLSLQECLIQLCVVRSDGGQGQAETLAQDMADLMHDFDVVSR